MLRCDARTVGGAGMKSGAGLVLVNLGETWSESRSELDPESRSKTPRLPEIGKSRFSRPAPDGASFSLDSLDPSEPVGE